MGKVYKKISKEKIKKANADSYNINYKPKTYHSAFLNTVNKDAWSTRPETVGKLATEIFPNYMKNVKTPSPDGWKTYYKTNHAQQYDNGLKKFKEKFEAEKNAINNITEQDLIDYYDDLMFNKTFAGLYVQEEILKDIAAEKNSQYRKPTAEEESKGIDGFIDGIPYSVKSETYKDSYISNFESINAKMVYYHENKNTKNIEYYIMEEEE